ncbi:unnamed protein product, partial [Amoebophrya sp. A25]
GGSKHGDGINHGNGSADPGRGMVVRTPSSSSRSTSSRRNKSLQQATSMLTNYLPSSLG